MLDEDWLKSTWKNISSQVKVDKVFIETYRYPTLVSQEALDIAKNFFTSQNVEYSGGITFTTSGNATFNSFCYATKEHADYVTNLSYYTGSNFDSFILDDFFFTNCRTDEEIEAKGNLSWTEHRMNVMHTAGRDYVVGAAKSANPNCSVTVKYPNWYEYFPELGFDLLEGPKIFDNIWTGTETRNADDSQHLQQYLGYSIMRYFENIAPGRNGGGWIDTYGGVTIDRYAEQLWLTLLGKAKTIALFNYNDLFAYKLYPNQRTPWQDSNSTLNWDAIYKPNATIASVADYVFDMIDPILSKLGDPVGVKSYRPHNTIGDEFLQSYFGMIGVPIEMVPEYPSGEKVIFLTSQAKADPDLVDKIKESLVNGSNVIVTSGLIEAIPEKIAEIAEITITKKVLINGYSFSTSKDILVPAVRFSTNDAWIVVEAGRPLIGGTSGVPLLLRAPYSQGNLYVMVVPEDFGDLYNLPLEVLNQYRYILTSDLHARVFGAVNVSLFLYGKDYVVVENFNDETVTVDVYFNNALYLIDVRDQSSVPLTGSRFPVTVKAHSFRALQAVGPL